MIPKGKESKTTLQRFLNIEGTAIQSCLDLWKCLCKLPLKVWHCQIWHWHFALTKAQTMNDGILSSITFYYFFCFIRPSCIKPIPSGYHGYWLLSTGVCLMAFGRNGSTRIPVRNCLWIVSLLPEYFHCFQTKYICYSWIHFIPMLHSI